VVSVVEAVAPGVGRIDLRTPTLPPATHTNAVILGRDRLTVVDPASPWPDEQARLVEALAALGRVERIVLTHHHADHVGGVEALRAALGDVPVVAHPVTAALLHGDVRVDATLDEGDVLDADGVVLDVLHTPGHAPGHLVLHERASGVMVAGDMVAGVGTILIDPTEGDLGDYLASLARMQRRAPGALVPSHGPALADGVTVLGFYVAHRHLRTQQILEAIDRHGPRDALELVPLVYGPDLDPAVWPVAAVQIEAHLRWMAKQGMLPA
jgi:glyoxylase-like metal-dependent hydrolase (beta-lactamase superfamily II)